MEERIKAVLERVKPMLALHRGGVEFVSFDGETKTARLRLTGTCQGCPLSQLTLKHGIEDLLKSEIPDIEAVEAVE
ncbi:MAG: NifU family protein [Candidatus Sungbacteria bacterium]|nr:NifU family protein [Candidatus Sungbacteria bacterium]